MYLLSRTSFVETTKLYRNYDVFLENTNGLHELLDRLSKKLGIDPVNINVSS